MSYGPPMPAAPQPKKPSMVKWGCGGCLAVVVLIVIVAAVVSVASGGGSKAGGSNDAENAPAARASSTGKPAREAAAPKPRAVLTDHGDGIKDTASFTVSGDWELKYSYDCSSFGQAGNFQVYEDYPDGDILANALAKKGAAVTHEHDGGKHWLKISSECDWKITVIDQG